VAQVLRGSGADGDSLSTQLAAKPEESEA
jgi:hypothetical protein